MRLSPFALAVAAGLCLLASGPAAAQQPAPASLERVTVAGRKGEASRWFRAESQRFVVYSDAREDDVAQLLDNLEKLDHLLRLYTKPAGQPGQPEPGQPEPGQPEPGQPEPGLTLYYASQPSALREVDGSGPADAVGLYSSCASGVQGFGVVLEHIPSLRDEQLDKVPLDATLSQVFEAYARHFLYRHTDIRTPASFIDGFAQYFSSVRFSDQQMVVGRTPPAIGAYLHFLNEGRRYNLDYDDVLLNRLDNAHSAGGAAGVRLEFEAKSWLLTHYMLSSDDNRKRLSRYLAFVDRGVLPTTAFERAFDVKPGGVRQVMWRYGLSSVKVLRVAVPTLPAAKVSFHTLPQATGEFLLAEAALKSCPGRPAGEALLKRVAGLAAQFPRDERGRLTLSRAQIDWGDPQDALPALEAVVATDDANFEARYLLGMAWLRQAERSAGDARRAQLQAALGHFQRARALNPQSPEAALAVFKAEVAATEEPGGAALQGVIAAWQSSREVGALTRSAALAYAFAGNGEAAHQALESLAENTGDASQAEWARQWQGRLSTGVARRDILAEMRREAAADTPFKEWTHDKQGAMRAVALAAGLEGARSFMQQQADSQRMGNLPEAPGR